MIDLLRNLIAGKKVLILGFGKEGKSSFLMIRKAGGYTELAIADQKEIRYEEIAQAGNLFLGNTSGEDICNDICNDIYPIVSNIITGTDYQESLRDYDIVFKSPGIVLEKDISSYACRIISQTEVFFMRFREQIVGITGTKGKSTTSTLLYHVLNSAGIPVVLGGNIGIPVFDISEDIGQDTVIVLELSSHQLEYMTISPRLGVLLNIHEEHLDHYGTMEKYVAAKQRIYTNQKTGDILFCNVRNLPEKGSCRADIIVVGEAKAPSLT